jgi:hypothetical protein
MGCEDPVYVSVDPFVNVYAYDCVDAADAACDGAKPAPEPVPGESFHGTPPVGLGAKFALLDGVGTSARSALSVERLALLPDGIVAGKEGIGVVAGLDGFTHVKVVAPTELQIRHESVQDSDDFDQIVGIDGFSLRFPSDRFRVVVYDDLGTQLAGSYPIDWFTTNPLVLTLQGDPHGAIATFELQGSGTASLEVKAGALTTNVSFQVN